PANASTIYLAGAYNWQGTSYDGVFKSTNGGGSWVAVNSGLPSVPEIHTLAANPQDGNVVFAGTTGGGHFTTVPVAEQGIYRTIDGGASWTQLHGGLPATGLNINQIAIHPAQPNVIYAGGETTNGGV